VHVDDKSGAGGLLPEEFPGIAGILNNIICADWEPMVRSPVAFMTLRPPPKN